MKKLTLYFCTCVVGLIIAVQSGVYAQFVPQPHAFPVDPNERVWNVSVSLNPTPKDDFFNVALLDPLTVTKVSYSDVIYFDAGHTGRATGFRLLNVPLVAGQKYQLLISTIVRKDDGTVDRNPDGTAKVETKSYEVAPVTSTQPAASTSSNSERKPTKSMSKDDSDFYFAGEMTKVSGVETAFTIDFKIEPKFGPGKWQYSPFFHISASNDPSADPDTMDIGFKTIRSFPYPFGRQNEKKRRYPGQMSSLYLSLGGKIESERDFDNTNFIFDPMLDFVLIPFPITKRGSFAIDPIVGAELGKNLNSPLPAAEGSGIARILAGVRMIVDIPLAHGIDGITFSGNYTRRWLLKPELGFTVNDDKTLSLSEFGKSPRDFVETKLDFNLNKFFGPYIAYDWGEVPPSYKLQDHRLRIGFTYKFKLSR